MRKRIVSVLLILALFHQSFMTASAESETSLTREEIDNVLWGYTIDPSIPTFGEYKSANPSNRPDKAYNIDAADFSRYLEGDEAAEPEIMSGYMGMDGDSVLTSENSVIEYEIYIEEAGLYDISLLYYPVEGKSSAIQRSFFVSGVLPYRELALIEFARIWQNAIAKQVTEPGYVALVWEKDNQGNDLKPRMFESPEWINSYLRDVDGYITSRLPVYFEAGLNTLTIAALREPMLLRGISLDNPPPPVAYADYKAAHDKAGAEPVSGVSVELQGQYAIRTSSQMLYPVQDSSSPALTPVSPRLLLNNTIGGHSWRFSGQWVEWDFSVPESGYYSIGLNVRQNFRRGAYTSRKISINGEVPFLEMEDYLFAYSQNWRNETLSDSDNEPFLFYIEAGVINTLRFETVLGSFAEVISEVRESIYELNSIYRKIIRLTGVKPDRYRDYQIERSLPELKGEMEAVRDRIEQAINEIRRIDTRGGGQERVLVAMRDLLNTLINNPERFARVLETYKASVRACGTWLNEAMLQPLQLDAVQISAPDVEHKLRNNSIFHRIWFELSRLFFSFFIDYSRIGNVSDSDEGDTITLWVGSGRDQANVIKSLIDERFTYDTGINVNVMLVDMSTLLQATLAGQGPDVALQVAGDLPMNFGLRNAVTDLSRFEDLPEIRERFDPSAMVPFEFNGATYALPETQSFPMLFYRKDILAELGLEVPRTWDDVKIAMAVLANDMMEFGMLPNELLFATLLFQNGGEYYNEDASRSALDSEEGINAFKIYTEFYTDYKLDRSTSVEERFRTGEAPMIIADYTTYNNFQVSAPDLRGMWGFAPVPATIQPDGTLNGVAASHSGACIIMEMSNKEASWEFLKWWTSTETQVMFGREMESLMGSAARVPTANLEAFSMLPWPAADYAALREQFSRIRGIPQVPGGYFSFRNVNNAFYSVTTPFEELPARARIERSPREELTDKVILINDEIRYKRSIFGLPLYGE
ncbi:MAG: extracellular solute-binding protein [Oscillospiraceae bacterium]|nr:extracellular solute-binding protein [Oscillospiraceae bacterium]